MEKKSKNWLKILLVILIPIAALVTLLIVLSGCDKSDEDENKQGINQTDTTNFRQGEINYTIKGHILSTQDILTLNDREECIEITEKFLTDETLDGDDLKSIYNDIIYPNVYNYLDKKYPPEKYLYKEYSYDEEQLYVQIRFFLYKIIHRCKEKTDLYKY